MKTTIILKLLCLLFVVSASGLYAQKGYEDWDPNYKAKSAEKVIEAEIAYVKKVEADTTEGHYYVAMDKFRFLATYTGKERPIDPENMNSMKRVFRIKTGSAAILTDLVSREFEFNIGSSIIWMPIQNQLITSLKNELTQGQQVLLYTLFTNEHKYTGEIINLFLISEFSTSWE